MSAAQTMALDWHQPWNGRDAAQALSLFCLTVEEQQARWHTIQLLAEYLASGTARKREVIAKELKACRQLYETVWAEMDFTFHSTLVEKTRQSVEQPGIRDQ
jgi:uncharacterized protein YoaH (UPF0181 family)